MNKSLNVPVLDTALMKAGLNQAGLAGKLDVSREAVSKWLKGECFPQPDKLLRIGMLLGLSFEELVKRDAPTAVPIVTYRKKANRKTRDEHLDAARETGELLKQLVKHLPTSRLATPAVLREPSTDYDYVQRVAADIRREMGLEKKAVIDFGDLIRKFNSLHAIIVPVLWGAKEQHGNALNIHLPDSQTTWVFLNLDSNAVDFKFWMAHELGHSLAPALGDQVGEDFADSFAQALLFPEAQASALHPLLANLAGVGLRIERIRAEARNRVISPLTIRLALEEYEVARHVVPVDLDELPAFMGGVRNFCKGFKTVSQALFKGIPPEPSVYASSARSTFDSPFFEALARFCKEQAGAEHFIHRVLGVSLADAKALSGELRK